jgi:DNA-binding transcriptional LysR family regulator
VEITIRTGTTEELVAGVLSYSLDGAFIGGKVKHSEIEQQPLVSEELVVVTEAKVTSLQELENPTLLVFRKGCSYRALLENWLHEAGILPYTIMEFGILDGILGCVAAGIGITMFPLSVIESLGYAGKITCHQISGASLHVPTMFIQRKNAVPSRTMEAFLQTALTREAPA